MIDCHFHLWTDDTSNPERREDRVRQIRPVMDDNHVDRVCLIHRRGESVEEARAYNRTVATFVEEFPDLFYGWARVNPLWGEEGVREFRRAVENDGLIGLKLYAQVFLDDPRVEPLAEAAVDMDVPIISHVAHRTERSDRKPKESTDEHVRGLAESFPNLKLISGHIGGGGQWERRIKNIAPLDNVYLDSSGSVTQSGMLEMAVDHLGVDRVVFGTDTWFLNGLGKLRGCSLSAKEKAIIGYNMARLLPDSVPNRLSESEIEAGIERAKAHFESVGSPRTEEIVDVNAFVGRYPFRPVDAEPDALIDRLDRNGVDRAVVSSLDSVFYRNPQPGNRALYETVAGYRNRLIPVATINPTYPGWSTDLEICLDELEMAGVKVLPAHHDYDLGDGALEELLSACGDRSIPVIIAGPLGDQRGRHPRVRLRGFETANAGKHWSQDQLDELESLLERCSKADVVVCNTMANGAAKLVRSLTESFPAGPRLRNFTRSGKTMFVVDDMQVFWPNDADRIVESIGTEHLVTGPRLPFRVFEAQYNAQHLPVDEDELDGVRSGHIMELFSAKRM